MVGQHTKLLLIEDNPGDVRLIREMLSETKRFQPQVIVADRLSSGLSYMDGEDFDAVLLDLTLPDSQGLDTLKQIQAFATETPVIVLTGLDDDQVGITALQAGAADYLVKGEVESTLLSRAIVYAIERHHTRDELYKLSLAVEQSPSLTLITDGNGRIEYVNPKFVQWTGYSPAEAIGQLPRILNPDEVSHDEYEERWNAITAGKEWSGEFLNRKKNGEAYWEYASISPITDGTGKIKHLVIVKEDITAYKQSEEALRQSERQLTTLMSNLPGMAYQCRNDQLWTMEFVSEGCFALTGYSPEQLIQNRDVSYVEIIHEADRDAVWNAIQTALRNERPFQLMYRIFTADGDIKWVWEHGRLVDALEDNQHILEGFITDISERKQAEQALQERVQELDVLYDASRRLSRSLDLDAVCKTLHDVIRQIMDCDWLYISSYDAETQHIRCEYAFAEGQPIDISQLPPLPLAPDGKGTQSTVIRTGKPVYFADYQAGLQNSQNVYAVRSDGSLVDRSETEASEHPRSAFIVPLRHQEHVVGVIQVKSFKLDAYSANRRRILELLTNQAATAFSNARLFQQAQDELAERKQAEAALARYTDRLQTLHNIDRAILSAQTPENIAQVALDHIRHFVAYQRLFVLVFDQEIDAGRVIAVSDKGKRPITKGAILQCDDILGFDEIRERRTVVVSGLAASDSHPMNQALFDDGVRTIINIPFFVQDKLIGMIGWRSTRPTAPPDEHIEMVREVGDQLAVAIQQVNLHQAEREQRQYAEALAETAATVNSTLDLGHVLGTIATYIERVVPHDAAHILLVESGTAHTVSQRGFEKYGASEAVANFTAPVGKLVDLRHMAETRQPLAIPNVTEHAEWTMLPTTAWARSYAGAPICFNNVVIGFLAILSETADFYTPEHAKRLQGFADQAAIAIRNAQLYQELENYSGYLEQAVAERTTELQTSEAQYRAIVEDQTELIGRAWLDGTLTFVNDAYCRFFGEPQERLIGQDFKSLILEVDRPKWDARFSRLCRENPVMTIESRAVAANGETRWMEWTSRLIQDNAGTLISVQFVGRDITKRKQAEEEMGRVLKREMEISEMRSRFLSMASHDLRTPLAVIQSNTDMLKRYAGQLSEERKQEKLAQIQITIKRMVELLDDILLIGRTEAGKLEYNPELTELQTVCQTILAELQTSIGTQHKFDFTVKGDVKLAMLDPKLLRHILNNLLSNAIKYSPQGSTVRLALRFEHDQILLVVADEGIGIPKDNQKHLFTSFYRADNVGDVPGTGLGLLIVKQSAELHGGDVTYESEEGIGTTFTVTLPLNKPQVLQD